MPEKEYKLKEELEAKEEYGKDFLTDRLSASHKENNL